MPETIPATDYDALTLARQHAAAAHVVLELLDAAGSAEVYLPIEKINELNARATAEAATSRAWTAVAHAEALLTRVPSTAVPSGDKH
jgi:hypothetical protein